MVEAWFFHSPGCHSEEIGVGEENEDFGKQQIHNNHMFLGDFPMSFSIFKNSCQNHLFRMSEC
jgi:hypothetical protein